MIPVNRIFDEALDFADHGEISLEMTFDAGHRIVGHKGKCARLHGHTYKAHIMASGVVKEPGFVVDFGDIKDLVNKWDHRLLLWNRDPFLDGYDWTFDSLRQDGIETLQFNPTAEMMAWDLATRIKNQFELTGVMVELWETQTSMARYVA